MVLPVLQGKVVSWGTPLKSIRYVFFFLNQWALVSKIITVLQYKDKMIKEGQIMYIVFCRVNLKTKITI